MDARDQYSLACVVYEMLTGEPPFSGSGARATMARHADRDAAAGSGAAAERPGCASIERSLRALAKDPADRFADMPSSAAALVNPVPT